MSRALSVAEAADLTGCSERSIRRWCAAGLIRGRHSAYHGRWAVPREALRAAGLINAWPTGTRSTPRTEHEPMTKPREPDEPEQARERDELAECHVTLADLVGDDLRVARLIDAASVRLTEARKGGDDDALREAATALAGLREARDEIETEHATVSERVAELEAAQAEANRQAAHAAAIAEADRQTEAAHAAADTFTDAVLAAHVAFVDALDAANAARRAASRPTLRVEYIMQTAAGGQSNRTLAHQVGALAGHAPARHMNDRPTAAARRQVEADRRAAGLAARQAHALAFLRGHAQERADRFAVTGFTVPGAELQGWTATLDRIRDEHGPDALDGLDLPPGYAPPATPPGGTEHEHRS